MYTGIDKHGKIDFTNFDKNYDFVRGLLYPEKEMSAIIEELNNLGQEPIYPEIEQLTGFKFILAAICAGIMKLMGFRV